jgi:F-type H+-transporting ATPase subunit alpha
MWRTNARHPSLCFKKVGEAWSVRIGSGYRMTELLKQGVCRPMHVTDQVLSIYAGIGGHLDKIPLKEVHAWEETFLKFIRDEKQALWQKITDTRKLDDDSAAAVDRAIAEFQGRYAGKKETVTV